MMCGKISEKNPIIYSTLHRLYNAFDRPNLLNELIKSYEVVGHLLSIDISEVGIIDL